VLLFLRFVFGKIYISRPEVIPPWKRGIKGVIFREKKEH
jgi:hypothetical protein